jgi:hypothetical protein
VPRAIPVSSGKIGLQEFFSWASRQFLMAKTYDRGLFRAALIYHGAWLLWVILGSLFYSKWFWPLFLLTFLSQVIKAELRLSCAGMIFPNQNVGHRLYHWFLSPLIAFCNFCMLFRLLFVQKVQWRGIVYTLLGPNKLKIER